MSSSSPDDLATTFRSLGRRRREAIGDAEPAAVASLAAELQSIVEAAATAVGSAPDAESVAAAIQQRRPDAWDEPTLDELRRQALDAGAVLRRMATATESDDD